MAKALALIVAAGRGHRVGGAVPKQYQPLGGQPLLRRTVTAFTAHPAVDAVRVVIDWGDRTLYDSAVAGLGLLDPVAGGATRQESVLNGLESLVRLAPERVLIHDAARPLVGAEVIARTIAALDAAPAAVAALPVGDTLKRARDGWVALTVPREGLWRAQTPQAFRFPAILAAHRAAAGLGLTDDGAVAEHAGLPVRLVEGSEDNIKLTTPEDFARAERLLAAAAAELRVGLGFDAHRFGAGAEVHLCGVRIPFERALLGHSDGDAGLHALVDALFGALGAGDLGDHFPPAEARWAGAASAQFLAYARDLVARARGEVVNVDVTLICERPRVAPHRAAMVARVAEVLGIAPDRVSVKATTTDGMGFTGRGEGVAAQAVATVRLWR